MLLIYGLALVVIGFFQVIGALIRLLAAERQSSTYAIKLKQYLIFVAVYFFINYIFVQVDLPDFYLFSYLFIIPPFVALWYWNHTRTWAKKYKRIKDFDKGQRVKNNYNLLLEVPCQERLELEKLPKKKVKLVHWNGKLKIAQ